MIKIEANRTDISGEMEGNAWTCISEAIGIVNAMYNSFKRQETIAADLFRYGLLQAIADDSLWQEKEVKHE